MTPNDILDLILFLISGLVWLWLGAVIWFVWADGAWFLSWGRTGQALLLFMVCGPFSMMAYPIERIIQKMRKT